jgi:CheY-like chemotaxis protein
MPAVLLVEDDETNRRLKASVLKELAGRGPVVAVESSDEAIRAVRALPGFDLIVTDINLPRPGDRSDTNRDGISFARWLRRSDYPTLLTGYSSVFSEGEISKEDRELFHSFLGRGEGADEIIAQFASWLSDSTDFRKRRAGAVPSFAEGLVSVDVIDLKEERAIRELLDDDFKVKLGRLTGAHKHARQFFVWFRDDPDEGAFVEVFGQPYLYASGATLDDAEAQLGVLMSEYMEDIGKAADDTLGRSMIDLRNFLREVFGAQA